MRKVHSLFEWGIEMKTCIDDFGSTFSNSNLGLLMNPELDVRSSDEIGPKNARTLSKPGLV